MGWFCRNCRMSMLKLFVVLVFSDLNALPTPWTSLVDNSLDEFYINNTLVDVDFAKNATIADFISHGVSKEEPLLDLLNWTMQDDIYTTTENPIAFGVAEVTTLSFDEETSLLDQMSEHGINIPGPNRRQNADVDLIMTTKSTPPPTQEQTATQSADFDRDVEEFNVTSPSTITSTTTEDTFGNQEEESGEEDMDFVQSLISQFLSGLSTPEGGVDVDAIVGLVGSLSVPRGDGTYDFSGLTETLQSILGGDDNGGGSNVGSFIGGLASAFIQGVAMPPGAKGAGILSGNLIASILPGLSAPTPQPEGSSTTKPDETLDVSSFVKGVLKGLAAGSMGGNATANGWPNPLLTIKQTVMRTLVAMSKKPPQQTNGWK